MQADATDASEPRLAANVYAFRRSAAGAGPAPEPDFGAVRLRLWDLPGGALCPVVGAALPIEVLRARLDALFGGSSHIPDHALHAGVVRECLACNPVSVCVDEALTQRHAAAIAALGGADADGLEAAWRDALDGGDLAGTLWAVVAHPACSDAMRETVLADLHMAQHHACDMWHLERGRSEALAAENRLLKSALDEQVRISAGLRSLLTRGRKKPAWRWWSPLKAG